jgi:hypothetical protein
VRAFASRSILDRSTHFNVLDVLLVSVVYWTTLGGNKLRVQPPGFQVDDEARAPIIKMTNQIKKEAERERQRAVQEWLPS